MDMNEQGDWRPLDVQLRVVDATTKTAQTFDLNRDLVADSTVCQGLAAMYDGSGSAPVVEYPLTKIGGDVEVIRAANDFYRFHRENPVLLAKSPADARRTGYSSLDDYLTEEGGVCATTVFGYPRYEEWAADLGKNNGLLVKCIRFANLLATKDLLDFYMVVLARAINRTSTADALRMLREPGPAQPSAGDQKRQFLV